MKIKELFENNEITTSKCKLDFMLDISLQYDGEHEEFNLSEAPGNLSQDLVKTIKDHWPQLSNIIIANGENGNDLRCTAIVNNYHSTNLGELTRNIIYVIENYLHDFYDEYHDNDPKSRVEVDDSEFYLMFNGLPISKVDLHDIKFDKIFIDCGSIQSLKGIENIFDGNIDILQLDNHDNLKGILSLCKLLNVKKVQLDEHDNIQLEQIINKYLGKPNKLIEFSEELIENGFKEYAKL